MLRNGGKNCGLLRPSLPRAHAQNLRIEDYSTSFNIVGLAKVEDSGGSAKSDKLS